MSKYKFSLDPQDVPLLYTNFRTVKTHLPCPGSKEIVLELAKYESRSMHGQIPLVWDHAYDFNIWDSAGNRWIDFTSTIFVANVGHSNKNVLKKVKDVLEDEIISTYAYPNKLRALYIKKLVQFSGKDFEKAFLLSAGTEATEAAVKLMKMNGRKLGKEKNLVISIEGNWHGRTMGAQLLSSNSVQKDWISNTNSETVQIPFPYPWKISEEAGAKFAQDSIDELCATGISLEKDISGIILETFQGWAAAYYPKSYVGKLREICDQHGILLCFDEMQSGFGRTGFKFGYEYYEVKADLICCGKGMGGGFPVSGVLASAEIMDLPDIGNMSSTHSGNPIVCAAGLAVLEEIEKLNLIKEAERKGKVLHSALSNIKDNYPEIISSIQGKGLIAAIIFETEQDPDICEKVSEVAEMCFRKGLLVVHTGRESIKIGPPLTIPDEALLEGINVLEEAIFDVFRNQVE